MINISLIAVPKISLLHNMLFRLTKKWPNLPATTLSSIYDLYKKIYAI